jgi:UDP-N-acetylmuramoyl-tripeptide--D-alanyl-D-alanine ligase
MLYPLRDLPGLLRTPVGREFFYARISFFGWPLVAPLAAAYRQTLGRRTRVSVVVGSLGKTTTTRALVVALGGRDQPLPNLNACSHVGLAMLAMRPGQPHGVLEVGIGRRGQMLTYARVVRPDVVVVTSIASDHRPQLGTLEDTRDEKAEMVRALPATGVAVLNGDDERVRWMATQTRARVVTYGFADKCDVRASDYTLDWPHGSRFTLLARGQRRTVRTHLLGRHQVHPILAAVTTALEHGVDLDLALARLAALSPSQNRLYPLRLANGAYVLRDEYKASQETYEAALDLLAQVPAQRRLALLAEVDSLPTDEGSVYRALGERAARVADRVVIVASEEASRAYADGAQRAGMPPTALTAVGANWRLAADLLGHDLGAGDVVLVKSGPYQRMDRVTLALAGRNVRCELVTCPASVLTCDRCPMLERGWNGHPPGDHATLTIEPPKAS